MTCRQRNELPLRVESFFRDYLTNARGASQHTLRAYRDALRLFFIFLANDKGGDVARLCLDDLCIEKVVAFLTHLEAGRHNSTASRNCRLAALRSFFKHLLRQDPQRADQYQRVLALPAKNTQIPVATYLEPEDVQLLLAQPDRRTSMGLRDYALILFLYNTGARVSEAISLRVDDVYLASPRQVCLHGKGGKDRICPLWSDAANALRQLPTIREGQPNDFIFCNRNGSALSRDGVAYLLRKYMKQAARQSPLLKKIKMTPHVMRHSCAVALLQAGIDITVIRDYLGHASIATTGRYVTTNLRMKREALDTFWQRSGLAPAKRKQWRTTPDLLKFLASL